MFLCDLLITYLSFIVLLTFNHLLWMVFGYQMPCYILTCYFNTNCCSLHWLLSYQAYPCFCCFSGSLSYIIHFLSSLISVFSSTTSEDLQTHKEQANFNGSKRFTKSAFSKTYTYELHLNQDHTCMTIKTYGYQNTISFYIIAK